MEILESGTLKSGAEYYAAAKDGVVRFENNFKNLTAHGKFEALLFNSVIITYKYCEKHIIYFEEFNEQLARSLALEAKMLSVSPYVNDINSFIEKRLMFYIKELQEYDNREEYLSSKIYYCFFIKALSEPSVPEDFSEVFPFHIALFDMMDWLRNETKKIDIING